MKDPERATDLPGITPHPVLRAYYQRPDERHGFVRGMFDRTAGDYDRIERLVGLGNGSRYRHQALLRAGLQPGMRVLDVAMGTGLVAREAAAIVGNAGAVVGLDASVAMMRRRPRSLAIPIVQGTAEFLPFADSQFDFVSLGFALRHVADLKGVFCEFRRVLRPGGILCMLEITLPEARWARGLLRFYLGGVVPLLAYAVARDADTPRLARYFWDTVEVCVSPTQVMGQLELAGLSAVHRHVEVRVFSEYTARS